MVGEITITDRAAEKIRALQSAYLSPLCEGLYFSKSSNIRQQRPPRQPRLKPKRTEVNHG